MADNSIIRPAGIQSSSSDPLKATIHGKLNGLYYYYLEQEMFSESGADNTAIFGTTAAIANLAYVPFLNVQQSDMLKIPFDTKRYGRPGTDPQVFRLFQFNAARPMELAETYLYPPRNLPHKDKNRNYINESRLLNYPYRTIMFTSNVFEPFQVIPHLLDADLSNNKVKLNSVSAINPGGNFYVYVDYYKGDTQNVLERQYSTTSLDLPNTSSAYSNYMSTQKAQSSFAVKNQLLQSSLMPIQGALNGVASGGSIAGMIGGGIFGAASGAFSGAMSAGQAIGANMAMKQDLITTPKSLSSIGGDIMTKLGNDLNTFVVASEMVIMEEYQQRLGDYFAMYGYKQNKVLFLHNHLRTRYYYNYIKTVGCNVSGTGVPKEHLNKIKAIFDKGVTLWHVDRNGGKFMDYSKDNSEMITI